MIWQRIIPLLKCIKCGHDNLLLSLTGSLVCSTCSHQYTNKNNIPDLMSKNMMPGSKLYTDPDYLQWETMRASSHDYFYGSKGIISWVQASGHQAIARMMESKQYQAIVDLGCGDGAHYPYIKQTEKYVGVDIDQPTLERFKLKQPDCCLLRVNGFELPFKDKSVDCLINIYNLEHMMYLDIALEEMNRILTEQGDVYISVPNEGGFLWGLGRSLSSVKHYKNINYPRIIEIEHINCIWQLEKAFKRHFKIKKKEPFPFSLPGFHANIVTTYHCVKI